MADDTLAARVRTIRTIRHLTQADLAERAGMARTDVNKLERGKLRLGRDRLARVAAALEVSVLELQPEAEPDELGLTLLGRQEELAGEVVRLTKLVQALARRVGVLERQAPAGAAPEEAAR